MLASLVAVKIGYPIVDAIGALVVAVFIARAGLQIGLESSNILADRVVLDEDQIRRVVVSVPQALGSHHIRTRGTADYTFLDLHVWFAPNTTLVEAHRLSHVVKDRLMEAFPQIRAIFTDLLPQATQRSNDPTIQGAWEELGESAAPGSLDQLSLLL